MMPATHSVSPVILAEINAIIRGKVAESRARTEAEIAGGKILIANPVAIMRERPTPVWDDSQPAADQEDVTVVGREAVLYRFTRSVNDSHIEARHAWGAYEPVHELLKHHGWTDEEIYPVIPRLFEGHHTFGVLAVVYHHSPSIGDRVLMGIRSAQLAGTNTGTASFPGGLVGVHETLLKAIERQMPDEGACGSPVVDPVFAFGPHNEAPSDTFVCAAHTSSEDIKESFEWKKDSMIWVPSHTAHQALLGNNAGLVAAFRDKGINVGDDLKVAPDAVAPARTIMETNGYE